MSYFQSLKDSITCRDAAEQYGLEVNAAGMARCPFHEDRHPSLKLGRGFHCFGCGAHGDVISFVSRLFGISAGDAAQKLARNFGILVHLRGPPTSPAPDSASELEQWITFAKDVLHSYYDLLVMWKQKLYPTAPEETWHPLFVEALQRQADIRELIHTLEFGSKQKQQEIYTHYRKTVITIDERIRDHEHIRDFPTPETG
jgi:hypothetical protein